MQPNVAGVPVDSTILPPPTRRSAGLVERVERADPTTRFDLSRNDVGALLQSEPRYRVDQVWGALYREGLDPDEITTLPKALRSRLSTEPTLSRALTMTRESMSDDGNTVKWLWQLHDGAQIETVLMHYRERTTVCISSQAGCAMGCGFCATGQSGFQRHLRAGEIIEQVVRARRRATLDGRRLSNVVYMGMGEPMANYSPVLRSVRALHEELEMSARHLTISTVGIIPGIRKLAEEQLPVNLAVSLHAADNEKRNLLVPINRTYPLGDLGDACAEYFEATRRRVTFEWALIRDTNDTLADARQLAAFARPLHAHVNLIPLNPTPGFLTVGSSATRVREFCDALTDLGVNATVRRNRGTGIDAACGQLAARAANTA